MLMNKNECQNETKQSIRCNLIKLKSSSVERIITQITAQIYNYTKAISYPLKPQTS